MGYSTSFSGELRFATDPTASQLAKLNTMFGEDCRDHPEWDASGLYYIDLELTPDFLGIKWNGAEKTYGMDKCVNVITKEMRKEWPEFAFVGGMLAQGEDIEDRWTLSIGDDGMAFASKLAITGKVVTCPHCEQRFELASLT